MLDCTYRLQIPHRKGQLAQVMGAIAEGDGLIGDVVTIWLFQTKTGVPVGRLNKMQFADGSMLRDSQVGGENGERTDDGLR